MEDRREAMDHRLIDPIEDRLMESIEDHLVAVAAVLDRCRMEGGP